MSPLIDVHRKNLQLAYNFIQDERILTSNFKSNYQSFAKRLPILIMKNGLIPTLLFISKKRGKKSENENEFDKISEQILAFFKSISSDFSECGDINVLIKKLIDSNDETKLMEFTKRLVDYASAIKEVSEAYLGGGGDSGPQTP